MMNRRIGLKDISIVLLLLLCNCANKEGVDVKYLREGKLMTEMIPLDIIKNGEINSPYIESIKFSILDSISYPDGNPDRKKIYSTPLELDFNKTIEVYSPEYYTIYTVHNIEKVIAYYNKLFDNRIDFNFDKKYRNIGISFGDITLFTTPDNYFFERGSHPSPSLFFHEIGHRAFWYIEDELKVNFGGLSYIHMGLLEYYTVSLNNSPVIGEDALPTKSLRNASWLYGYPPADSLNLANMMGTLKESFPEEMENPQSNISKFYNTAMSSYKDYMDVIDNHKGGMILTSTLWRIREQIGQENTDKLVTQAIFDLNSSMEQRNNFYQPLEDEELSNRIEWYDLFYSLIKQDRDLFNGENRQIIIKEFEKTNFPVNRIKL